MPLYLIRHPRPLQASGRCYGREDLEVDGEALRSAAASVRARISAAEIERAKVFTSPLSRCLVLARELAGPREPTIAEDLIEMHFGSWEGRAWDAVPRDELSAWAGNVWRYRPGDGESAALVARRWRRWSSRLRAARAGTTIAVTHAGFIRVALACAGRLSIEAFANHPIEFGSVHAIEFEEARMPAWAAP
jgi:alpha-ribazole phosphatase